jgi:hypothetical protein
MKHAKDCPATDAIDNPCFCGLEEVLEDESREIVEEIMAEEELG